MIQINTNTVKSNKITEETQQPQRNYIIHRIFYASILIATLLLISFYFDLLHDYDLSLLLGFVVAIILQFSFLSYYFQDEMKKYKMDQIVKWKIKLIFGQLDHRHVDKKNKVKYYWHESNEKDRLFHKDNEQIHSNVISYLRSKEETNFTDMINKEKGKWNFLQQKIGLLEQFLKSTQKQYENRKAIYGRYKGMIARMKEKKEYNAWEEFLRYDDQGLRKRDTLNDTSFYSQNFDQTRGRAEKDKMEAEGLTQKFKLNWEIFNWFMLQKIKINQNEVRCLKQNIITDYSTFNKNIRSSKDNNSKQRDKLLADLKTTREEKNQIVKQIERVSIKYAQLKQSLEINRKKQGQDVQVILKREFDLRMIKVELENLEIKVSRANSMISYNSELLYNHLQSQESELEDQLNKFNSKFKNYMNMMAGMGENRTPIMQKYLQDYKKNDLSQLPSKVQQLGNSDFWYIKYTDRKKSENIFKNYLNQVLNLFKQMKINHSQSIDLIQSFKPRFEMPSSSDGKGEKRIKNDNTGLRLHYYASNVNDLKILKMFQKINYFELKYADRIIENIERQHKMNFQFQEISSTSYKRIKLLNEDYQRKKQKVNRKESEISQLQIQAGEKLIDEIKIYIEKQKIETVLLDIIEIMIQNQGQYERYASEMAEEEQYEIKNWKEDNQEVIARQRYNAYMNCISKQQLTQFEEDNLLKENYFSHFQKYREEDLKGRNQIQISSFSNYSLKQSLLKQKNKDVLKIIQLNTFSQSLTRSIDIVNKLLGVLFNQWSKSTFFHQFVKEELLLSLNRKRPDLVEHLNIEYFKIIQKDKNINPIKDILVHQTQIYRCMFDVVLNFKGKIAVQIGTKLKIGKKPALQIKLLIKQFQCPIRICFTPYCLGKSYASLLERPKLTLEYSVLLEGFNLTKIPFFTKIISTYIVLKLRKKMLWPKRMTLAVPLSFKSTIDLAIAQKNKYERDKQKLQKKAK